MKSQACKEVVLFLLQKLVVEGDARSHEFGDSSFDDFLRELGIFELVADCNLVARAHQARQIHVKRMVGETGHRDCVRSCIGALCQHDSQHFAGYQGIVTISLIKVSTPEQKQRLRVLRLHGEELLHHRCLGRFFLCHIRFFISANA